MNADISTRHERFIRRQVRSGRYRNQSEVVRDALARLERDLEGKDYLHPPLLPPGTLEAIYQAETATEREWENRTAEASSLKAEAF